MITLRRKPSSSGGGTWGSITGTLGDQTDLQSALTAKLNLSGGTMTGALTINGASGPFLDIKQSGTDVFKVSYAVAGTCIDSRSGSGGQALIGDGGIYIGRRDSSNPASASGYEAWIGNYNASGINIRGTGFYGFGTDNGTNLHSIRNAAFYYGGAANTIQIGATHATVATLGTLAGHRVTSGVGGPIEIAGGVGGSGRGNVTLNGGNRAAYAAAPSVAGLAGGSTVDISALDTWAGQVNATLDALVQAVVSHGLMQTP